MTTRQTTRQTEILPATGTTAYGSTAVRRTSLALVVTVWVSAMLFGIYILAHYAGAVADEALPSWNAVLPRLYEPTTPAATVAIGVHFLAGGVILVLGCVQLIPAVRARWPAVHRGLGRVYVGAALLAGLGGLGFIAVKGTVGGLVMNVGFGLYGVLVVGCAVQAYRYARARRIEQHRVWALRLFALAIGSWLYRMEYGFWLLLVGDLGHTDDFHGPFDRVMAFFFYVPNLLVVEALLRGRGRSSSLAARRLAVAVQLVATGFLLLGTYFFTVKIWAPSIAQRFA